MATVPTVPAATRPTSPRLAAPPVSLLDLDAETRRGPAFDAPYSGVSMPAAGRPATAGHAAVAPTAGAGLYGGTAASAPYPTAGHAAARPNYAAAHAPDSAYPWNDAPDHAAPRALPAAGPAAPAAADPANLEGQLLRALNGRVMERPGRARVPLMDRAMFLLFLRMPDKALEDWNRAAREEDEDDIGHPLLAAYLHLALGDLDKSAERLEETVRRVERRRPFRAVNPAFAQVIDGYRCYDPRPDRTFVPGEKFMVYLELEGVGFEPLHDTHRMRVSIGVHLHDEDGRDHMPLPQFGALPRRYQTPVREINLAVSGLAVPADTPAGRYTLRVTVHDDIRRVRAEAVLPMEIAGRFASARPAGALAAGTTGRASGDAAEWTPPENRRAADPARRDDGYADLEQRLIAQTNRRIEEAERNIQRKYEESDRLRQLQNTQNMANLMTRQTMVPSF